MRIRFQLVLGLSAVLLSVHAFSQCGTDVTPCVPGIPHLIKFTGTLHDPLGQPRTGIAGVTFLIYGDSTGGAPLWQEVQNVQLDPQGRYAVLLGSATSGGVPPNIFSSGESRWLGVQASFPGEQEQPRVLLVSVPYAMKAGDAQTLGGLPPSAFLQVTPPLPGQVASGSGGAPTPGGSPRTAAGPRAAADATLPVTTAGGTPDALAKFGVGGTSMVDSQITDSSGVVSVKNLANTLFADRFPGGVPDAIAACPAAGCIINAVSASVNRDLGNLDPGHKSITLYLGPYTYNIKQIMLRSQFRIMGMGSGSTYLQSVNGNNPVIVVPQENFGVAVNVVLSGFRLVGSVGNTSEDAIYWDASGFFAAGVWYSELNDIFIFGFAGNAIHLVGTSADFTGMSQWVVFNRVIVFRPAGSGNALRIEGAAYELNFNDCQFDGTGPTDGTNIFIAARTGNSYAIPIDINFRALTSQNAATAVHIDGGWAVHFDGPHHEYVSGVYLITGDRQASIAGITISDAGFQASGVNNGAGYLLNVLTPAALGVRFTHNNIMGPADKVVSSVPGSDVVYQDNIFLGATSLPTTVGVTAQFAPAPSINIRNAHTVGLASSATPITTIQSALGPGETVTFFALGGPVIFGSGGNINLMGAPTITITGSITFMVSDLGGTPSWIPVSQWNPAAAKVPAGFDLSSRTLVASIGRSDEATFEFMLKPRGSFSGSVTFSCVGTPPGGACIVSPSPIAVAGPNILLAKVGLVHPQSSTTFVPEKSAEFRKSGLLAIMTVGWMGMVTVPIGWSAKKKKNRALLVTVIVILIMLCTGCGAGSPETDPTKFPPGYYTLEVTATAGAYSRSIHFDLNVE